MAGNSLKRIFIASVFAIAVIGVPVAASAQSGVASVYAYSGGRTASGEIKRNWGHKRHRLISKSKDGKRLRRGTTTMEKGDAGLVLTYMPYLRS